MARILVVDDDPLTREVVKDALVEARHDVKVVEDGTAVIDSLLSEKYAVLVLDVNMPRVSGGKLVEMIQKMVPKPHPRILLFSGEDASKLRRLYRELGLHGFVRKGCNKKQLLDVIQEAATYYEKDTGGAGGSSAPPEPLEDSSADVDAEHAPDAE